jgi:muramoyltetrapeptide carboxypeptidase LdcA involved in peptidoglycan recycling
VFGRPGGAELPVGAHLDYDAAILRVVRDEQGLHRAADRDNVDVGHTDPMWTVPQGARLRIDPTAATLTFLDPAVR